MGDCRVLCFLGNLGLCGILFKSEKESRITTTKSHPAVGSGRGYRSARRAL